MLCVVCISMLKGRRKTGYHHLTPSALEQASKQGCPICKSIQNEREAAEIVAETPWKSDEPYVWFKFEQRENSPIYEIHLAANVPDYKAPWLSVVYLLPGQINALDPANDTILPRKETPSQSTHNSIPTGSRWLENCIQNHASCGASSTPLAVPRRLLQLEGDTFRLIDTDSEHTAGPYVTLSHCWGTDLDFMVLKASNIEQFHSGMNLRALPQNFRDAFHIVRGLGLKYLWIDSLCILQSGQGSMDDWEFHASQMASVYSNCIVNIATHQATNPNESCFPRRDTRLVEDYCISWHGFKEENTLHCIYDLELFGHGALRSSRLSTRAWVIQERLLSPRVLHFCPRQIFWECNELPLACEAVPAGSVSESISSTKKPSWIRRLDPPRPFNITFTNARTRSAGGHTKTCPVDKIWEQIVEEYTSCDLTKPNEDKLVALAGVARRCSELRGEGYLAGFFPSDLLWHILWQGITELKRPRGKYRAPTWSWASVDGPVEWRKEYGSNSQLVAEVITYVADLVDQNNPWGALRSAKLTLRGVLLVVSLSDLENSHVILPSGGTLPLIDFQVDEGESSIAKNRQTYYLPIYSTSSPNHDYFWTGGLILQGETSDALCRIGKCFVVAGSYSDRSGPITTGDKQDALSFSELLEDFDIQQLVQII